MTYADDGLISSVLIGATAFAIAGPFGAAVVAVVALFIIAGIDPGRAIMG
jgi:hypothetical protein